ncbi:MAG: hypothetical protein FJ255_10640 [Phycisphaerae bacterium]|nr:hypothetical protein [Phycisphaerae bacterium]
MMRVAWLALFLGACGSASPRFELANESETWLAATVWTRGADGVSFVPAKSLVVAPRGTLSLSGPGIARSDVLRVQVEALGPELKTPATIWYELAPPTPLSLRATGAGAELRFERIGSAGELRALSAVAARLALPGTDPSGAAAPWMPELGPEVPGDTTPEHVDRTLPKSKQDG